VSFELHRPATLAEATELALRLGPGARFLAGGTDLVIQIRRGRIAPAHLIDIGRLPGLDRIEIGARECALGALATYRAIERHPALAGELAALAQAAGVVGGHQVRNVATVGGNIVNASPAADFVPALLALDAKLDLIGPGDATRTVALRDFVTGPGRTEAAPGEILTTVRFERPPAHSATAFLKEGRRKAMEISVVCVAACVTIDAAAGTFVGARIAVGAAAPRAFRATRAEASLAGRPATAETFRAAGTLAAADASPISDVRASADYRRHLVSVLVERALAQSVARISGGST